MPADHLTQKPPRNPRQSANLAVQLPESKTHGAFCLAVTGIVGGLEREAISCKRNWKNWTFTLENKGVVKQALCSEPVILAFSYRLRPENTYQAMVSSSRVEVEN